jgi:hypothetical protein
MNRTSRTARSTRTSFIESRRHDGHALQDAYPVRFLSLCLNSGRRLFLSLAVVLLALGTPYPTSAQEVQGVPWTGAPGITQSVQEIMARERAQTREGGPVGETTRGRIPDNLREEPEETGDSKSAGFGINKGTETLEGARSAITAADVSTFALSQTVSTSFKAATLTDTMLVPPSPMGAVGPSQILMVINGWVKTFNKNGTADGAINVSSDTFFNSVRDGASTSDPWVVYDRLSQRWFVTMVNKSAAPNRVLIARSNGPTITSQSSFTFFQFQQDQPGGPSVDTGKFADYPSTGVDKFALYIGVNIFDESLTTFERSSVFVINKANLLAGTLTVTAFRNVAYNAPLEEGDGPFAPKGVTNMDPDATEGYFIGVNIGGFANLRILRVNNPGGTPSITPISLNVPGTRFPLDVPAQGSTLPLDRIDDRLGNATIVVNPNGTRSLWTTHSIRVTQAGAALNSGDRNAQRFYEITNLTGTPTLAQSGMLYDPSATNWRYFWVGSIGTSGQGHTILASSYASAVEYPGISIAGRLANDTLGTLNSTLSLIPGVGAYNVEGAPKTVQRWGDYTNVVVDPTDNMTMWAFQEYADAANSWGVRIIQLKAPPPAALTSVLPLTVSTGASTSVTITGTSSGGSGFYDPGAAFTGRLTASVSGTGVTVTSVTYTDPTHITLNLTIAGGAALTGRTITVTNPDGQSVISGANFLTITGPPSITVSPAIVPAGTVGVAYNQTVSASGGTGPYTYSITTGALPGGLTLHPTTGAITGTPNTSGTASFTVRALDSLSNPGTRSYNVNIQALLSSTVSLGVLSNTYDATPVGEYSAGRFTLNTQLTNIGAPISASAQLYFRVTDLRKYAGSPLIKLLSADNGQGVAGDIQTVNLQGVPLGTGQPKTVSFTLGIGSHSTFTINLDLMMVATGSALTAHATSLKASSEVQMTEPILLGRYQLKSAEPIGTPPPPPVDVNVLGLLSNSGVITGPGSQSRPSAAVDPVLPDRIAIASNDYVTRRVKISTSADGGLTWRTTTLGATVQGQTYFVSYSPSVAFDSYGRLSVVYSLANLADSANAIVISESSDLVNFSPPTALSLHPASEAVVDSRPVIAVHSRIGRVVAWDSRSAVDESRYAILVARSSEGGVFEPPITVANEGRVSSPALALSKNTIYVAWNEWGFNSSAPYTTGGRLMMAGATNRDRLKFESAREIARTSIGFGQKILAMPELGVGPNLAIAADPRQDDLVYAVFVDRGKGMDIRLGRTLNRGKKWEIGTVNDDTGAADQFSPSIALDADANLKIAFYDTRLSSTSETAHVFLARPSAKTGKYENVRVTTALLDSSSTNPLRDTTSNLGDRSAIAMLSGDVLLAWTDTRDGSEDIFASVVFDPDGEAISGAGRIKSKAGSIIPTPTVTGTIDFGFEAKYRKKDAQLTGNSDFTFQVGKVRLRFSSKSYQSFTVSRNMARLTGSGTINGAGNFSFVLMVADGKGSGGNGADKLRLRITDKATGVLIYDNLPGASDTLAESFMQSIADGRIEVQDR